MNYVHPEVTQTNNGVSVVLLKPECGLLCPSENTSFLAGVEAALKPNTLEVRELTLSRQQAQDLWGPSIDQFDWAGQYYDHLSSREVTAFVLQGDTSAAEVKKLLRHQQQRMITALNESLKLGFSPDMFHGSDPGCGRQELGILRIQNGY